MKKNSILAFALIGSLALLFTACEKEITNDPLHLVGTPIVFSASTSYDNGVETKAEYSGDLNGTSSKTERIDWKTNDPIKIIYNTYAGSYKVSSDGTADSEKSRASVTVVENGLTWGTSSSHTFYALYPNNSNGSLNGAVVTGTIPATQSVDQNNTITKNGVTKYQPNTKQYGFMFGYLNLQYPAATVELPFKPAFTTLEFKLKRKAGDEDKKIKTIQVSTDDETSGTSLTGTFQFAIPDALNLPAQNQITVSNTGKTITLDFSGFTGGGVSVPVDNYLDFSILALPVNQKYVKLMLTYVGDIAPSKKLSLKDNSGNWYEFTGGKKYIITNDNVPGGESFDYFIDEIDDVTRYGHNAITATDVFTYNVKSYKVKHGTTGPKYPVAWHMEYSYSSDNGKTWSAWSRTWPSSWPAGNNKFFSQVTTTSGIGYDGTTSQTGYTTLPNESDGNTTGDAGDATRAKLVNATHRGSASAPFDLSTHKVFGSGSTYEEKQADITENPVNRETANCYVVSAPGVYMFPLVYGNAIKNGVNNKISYDPANCGDTSIQDLYTVADREVLPTFRNAKNTGITQPSIVDDLSASSLSAVVVWQDAQNLILNPTVITVSGEPYQFIKFEVDANYIAQGNAIVALKGNATGLSDEILWSWHIWVTEKDLTPATITHVTNGVNASSQMMLYNLGWTDKTSASSTKWRDRRLKMRVVQDEPDAVTSNNLMEEFEFKQIGDATSTDNNVGSNPFYQWGRKDPMVGAASNNRYKTVYYATGYSLPTESYESQTVVAPTATTNPDDADFASSIKNPHKQYFNSSTWGWIGGKHYMTLATGDWHNSSTHGGAATHFKTAIPANLWNAGVNHQASGTWHHKTVYDPCPPGFCVPSSYAFTGMAGNTTQDYRYAVGTYSGNANEGRTFYASYIGTNMYFPYTGARGAVHGEIYDVSATAYYWVDSITSNHFNKGDGNTQDRYGLFNSKMMSFDNEYIWPFHNLYRAACYSIRPVIE